MRKFLISVLLFLLLFLLVGSLFLLGSWKHLPAPKITHNVSYNEKLRFIKENPNRNSQILALGSSMTLSNLSSKVVNKNFPESSLINLGALGFSIGEVYEVSKVFTPIMHPKLVIMCGYPIDFRGKKPHINGSASIDYLINGKDFWYYVKSPDLQYYLKQTVSNMLESPKSSEYDLLQFDENGGIPLKAGGGESKMGRFNKSPYFKIHEDNYLYLDSLCRYFASHNVGFKYFHTPVREGLINDSLESYLSAHSRKIAKIIGEYNFEYVNTNDIKWPDSLFIDYIHLNEYGAKLVTEYAFKQMHVWLEY